MRKKIDLDAHRIDTSTQIQRKYTHSFSNNVLRLNDETGNTTNDELTNNTLENEDPVNIVFSKNFKRVKSFVLIAIPFVFLMIFVTIFGKEDSSNSNAIGLNGYSYYPNICKLVSVNGDMMDIEEYVARVLPKEVGGFTDETLKVFAVSARTYLISNSAPVGNSSDDCYYNVTRTDDSFQSYSSMTSEVYEKAVSETKGIIITINNEVSGGYYDASCVYTASQAKELDPDGIYSDDNYYIKYGSKTIGGINFQSIPRIDAPNVGTLSSWASYADNGTPCYGNHGRGMSQNGSYYLENYKGYDWKEIISYYYNDSEELMSIYPTNTVSNNWTQEINATTSSSIQTQIMSKSIKSYISESEYQQLNNSIKENVLSAGVGTRSAVVAAAVTPIKYFAENYGVVIPYTMCGLHSCDMYSNGIQVNKSAKSFYGVDPDWGSNIGNYYYGSFGPYTNYGPDCSGFVPWVFHNAGISVPIGNSTSYDELGTNYKLGDSFIGQPGDIMRNNGHVAVIVGVDTENSVYYIAEAKGGAYGTVISKIGFNDTSRWIVDMTDYLSNHVVSDYENRFDEGVISY